MKHVGLIKAMVLAILFGLGLLIATADHRQLASVDLRRPTTILPLVAERLHDVYASVRGFRVRDQVDMATAGFRETVGKHERPKEALDRSSPPGHRSGPEEANREYRDAGRR